MVAPHKLSEPIRSLVRIPGEGRQGQSPGDGRASKALCWDLARSSSMVASEAPLQLPLAPPPPPPPPLPSSAPVAQEKAGSVTFGQKNAQQLPQPLSLRGGRSVPNEGKRLRDEGGEEKGEEGAPKPKAARTSADTRKAVQQASDPAQPRPGSEGEVQMLRLQCTKLQQQNEDLKRQLGQICNLLKDKHRRTSLMRQLDTLVK